MTAVLGMGAEKLVILHTNDTHSSVDPDVVSGDGGMLQRKAIFDSVRNVEKNTLLVDAGDVVQGSLYFKFFRGDVEYPLMNMAKYDIRILGNHEFDNGFDELAKYYKDVTAEVLSVNYDFSDTSLKDVFKPYVIKEVDGKKIGFIGVNIDPESLIRQAHIGDMKYKDAVKTANEVAAYLKKKKKCNFVVAITHIGVNPNSGRATDYDLVRASKYIDLVIGGHSHTVIKPGQTGDYPNVIKNAVGRDVLVAQTGKNGKFVGQITIDTDKLKKGIEAIDYKLIPVTDRFENYDREMQQFLVPYKQVIDSVNRHVIGRTDYAMDSDDRNGAYANFTADFAQWYGQLKLDSLYNRERKLDVGFMNVGGIRLDMPKGDISEGRTLSTFPFPNRMVIMEIAGKDIIAALQVAALKGGEAISSNMRVVLAPDSMVRRVIINDEIMNPEKIYTLCTIDYLSEGNDNLRTLSNGKVIWTDEVDMSAPLLRYIDRFTQLGIPVNSDPTGRFVQEVLIEERK